MATKPDGPVQVRTKVTVAGAWHGKHDVKRGDILEVPTQREALRMYKNGTAQPASVRELGRPFECLHARKHQM